MTQFLLKKAIPGICPYCGQDTGTIGERGAQAVFPCVHCQRPIRIDMSAGKRTFVKAAGTPGTPAGSQKKPLWDKTGQ